ncbi:flavin reductase family protein [Paraburkholderia sp. C35]|uniref:flavin reductase family protein n=1 Tax=Paraburkholderia sp. C35 TaxID=2126993 RepID=UPI000D68E3BA|nr:flavin reductase family protein [Paraburkholderia sp. C35]
MIIDSADLNPVSAYKLLIGSILPRPIAWVSTLSKAGVANIAPISFFSAAGRLPPMVTLLLQPRSDGKTLKDTFVNIRDTGEFTTNLVSLPHAHHMHQTATEFPSDVDEFDAVGLEKAPSVVVKPARIAGAPISFECKVERIFSVGDVGDHVVWGKVLRFHIRDDLYLENGRIDTGALGAVGRLAAEYTLVNNIFTTPLDPDFLSSREGQRASRLDGKAEDFSPIDTKAWSASGATLSESRESKEDQPNR